MRIIAGIHRSRKLFTPKDDLVTRPIPDRVKESVFSLLRGHFEGATVLDAFAGTGSIGLEAISRGATRVVFVERDKQAAEMLRRNVELLEAGDESEIVVNDALGPAALARCPKPVHLVFFDPPYPLILDTSESGWERVRRQFARFIDLLDETGFAVLRTPWPFKHVQSEMDTSEGNERTEAFLKGKPAPGLKAGTGGVEVPRIGKSKKAAKRLLEEHAWIGDQIDIEAIAAVTRKDEEVLEELEEAEMAAASVEKREVDLRLDNAQGPETHVYGSMAVHLYMRKRV